MHLHRGGGLVLDIRKRYRRRVGPSVRCDGHAVRAGVLKGITLHGGGVFRRAVLTLLHRHLQRLGQRLTRGGLEGKRDLRRNSGLLHLGIGKGNGRGRRHAVLADDNLLGVHALVLVPLGYGNREFPDGVGPGVQRPDGSRRHGIALGIHVGKAHLRRLRYNRLGRVGKGNHLRVSRTLGGNLKALGAHALIGVALRHGNGKGAGAVRPGAEHLGALVGHRLVIGVHVAEGDGARHGDGRIKEFHHRRVGVSAAVHHNLGVADAFKCITARCVQPVICRGIRALSKRFHAFLQHGRTVSTVQVTKRHLGRHGGLSIGERNGVWRGGAACIHLDRLRRGVLKRVALRHKVRIGRHGAFPLFKGKGLVGKFPLAVHIADVDARLNPCADKVEHHLRGIGVSVLIHRYRHNAVALKRIALRHVLPHADGGLAIDGAGGGFAVKHLVRLVVYVGHLDLRGRLVGVIDLIAVLLAENVDELGHDKAIRFIITDAQPFSAVHIQGCINPDVFVLGHVCKSLLSGRTGFLTEVNHSVGHAIAVDIRLRGRNLLAAALGFPAALAGAGVRLDRFIGYKREYGRGRIAAVCVHRYLVGGRLLKRIAVQLSRPLRRDGVRAGQIGFCVLKGIHVVRALIFNLYIPVLLRRLGFSAAFEGKGNGCGRIAAVRVHGQVHGVRAFQRIVH